MSIAQRVRAHNEENDGAFRPQLTSLIDVMTILLVFLLKNFSVEGEMVSPAKNLTLPSSVEKSRAEPRLSVQISQEQLLVNGSAIVAVDSFVNAEELLIEPLKKELERFGPSADEREPLMIEADKNLPFAIIKRVMFTCSKAGYRDYTILVIQEEA